MLHNPSILLRHFYYATPIAVVFCAGFLTIVSACFVRPSNRKTLNSSERTVSKWFTLAVAICYASEALIDLVHATIHPGVSTGRDTVTYFTLSTLLWLSAFMMLNEAVKAYQLPYVGYWALSLFLECVIWELSRQALSQQCYLDYVQFALKAARIICLSSLLAPITLPVRASNRWGNRRKPLPKRVRQSVSAFTTSERSSTEVEPEFGYENLNGSEGKGKDSKNEHAERLEDSHGWWACIQEFRIFLPHIIPSQDRKLQAYALGVALLILCDRASNLLGPLLLGDIVDTISGLKVDEPVPWRKIFFFIFVVKIPHDQVLVPLKSCLSIRLRYWSYGRLLLTSFAHVMSLSSDFHENKSSAEVQAAITKADSLAGLIDHLAMEATPLIMDLIVALGYLSYLFDIYFGLILASTYFVYVLITYKLTSWSTKRRREYTQISTQQKRVFDQCVSNWQNASYFNRQDYQRRYLEHITREEIDAMTKYVDVGEAIRIAQGLVMCLGYGAVLLLAAFQVARRNQPAGNIVMLLLYWSTFSRPLFSLTVTYKSLVSFVVDGEQLLEIWKQKPTIMDSPEAKDLGFKGGRVEFRDVSFSYDGHKEVINGITFTVTPGSRVAFVGQTGSGKTTTCNKLMFRLYDVTGGSILIDGQDIRDVTLHSLRETLGIVPQDPVFWNDTIFNVLRFARCNATDEDIYDACKHAAMHDSILQLPQGYQTEIGERGVKLSGGERQRLAIAQLFLRDSKIIVLDEATSAVDGITESKIQDSFAKLCKGRTTFVIAHRLSTIKDADQIFVLGQGRIMERGTHSELLLAKGKYYRLWRKKGLETKLNELNLNEALNESSSLCEGDDNRNSSDDDDGSSCTSIEGIWQVDGQTNGQTNGQNDGQHESKHMDGSNPKRIHISRKLHDLKERLSNRKEERQELAELFDAEEDDSPMLCVSPRPTGATVQKPSRHSFSLHRLSREVRRSARSGSSADQPSMNEIQAQAHAPAPLTEDNLNRLSEQRGELPSVARNVGTGPFFTFATSPPRSKTKQEAKASHTAAVLAEKAEESASNYHTPESSIRAEEEQEGS